MHGRYKQRLLVAPFILAPNAQSGAQIELAVGHADLMQDTNAVVDKLGRHVTDLDPLLPVTVQFFPYKKSFIAAITATSSTPELLSGRSGLALTFGAVIDPVLFLQASSPCTKAFEIITAYFESEYGAPFNDNKADEIISRGQSGISNDEIFHREKIDIMLRESEAEFGLVAQGKIELLRRLKLWVLRGKLLRHPRIRSFKSLTDEGVSGYWEQIDRTLRKVQHKSLVEPDAMNCMPPTKKASDPKADDPLSPEPAATSNHSSTTNVDVPYPILLQSFQQAITTIWIHSYLGVLVLFAFLWGQTAAQKDITSIVKVIVAVLSFFMILQSTERLLFLLSLWGLLSRQQNLKSKQSGRAVLMSWPRLFLLLVAGLGTILFALTLLIVLAPDIYQILLASFSEWTSLSTR